jgi:hypothetical protein
MSESSSLTRSIFAFILSGFTDLARTEFPRATKKVSFQHERMKLNNQLKDTKTNISTFKILSKAFEIKHQTKYLAHS